MTDDVKRIVTVDAPEAIGALMIDAVEHIALGAGSIGEIHDRLVEAAARDSRRTSPSRSDVQLAVRALATMLPARSLDDMCDLIADRLILRGVRTLPEQEQVINERRLSH